MTTYYDHAGIRVTGRRLTVGAHSYPIDHLRNLRTARGRGDRVTRGAVHVATLSLLLVASAGRLIPAPMSTAAVVVFVALPAAAAAVRARLVRPAYLLLADYRGRTQTLHETRNETEFGKISRALLRASTADRPGRTVPAGLRTAPAAPRPGSLPPGRG